MKTNSIGRNTRSVVSEDLPNENKGVKSVQKSHKYSGPKHIDGGLVLIVFVLICYGMVMLFSASMTEGFATQGDPMYFISRHILFTVIGIAIALLTAIFVPIRIFDKLWLVVALYAFTTILLLAVYIPTYSNPIIYGVELNGARRWLRIMGQQIQPSEIAKIAVIFCFAGYTSWVRKKREKGAFVKDGAISQFFYDGFIDIVIPAVGVGIWVLMILVQPHISWIVIVAVLSLFLFFNAKISFKSFISGILILAIIIGILLMVFSIAAPLLPDNLSSYVSYEYVSTRLAIYLDPETVSSDAMFQTRQSINAIGSGGIFGVGIGNSIQKWGYLPMQYNDYVFSIIAEELGFFGSIILILLFIAYFILGIKVALKAADTFSMIIAFGFSLIVSIQALFNIGVATNVLPPTGISLPFFSYGGSSTLIFLSGIGLLLCVSKSGIKSKKRK